MHPLDRWFRIGLPMCLGAVLLTIILVGMLSSPGRLAKGYAPEQPIKFSHKLHAGDNNIPCQYCHSGPEKSRYATVPSVDLCMNCHAVTKVESEQIKKLTKIYDEGGTIEWKRVHILPDHTYFDHRPHVNSGIECQVCHGPVEKMEKITQVMSMRMGACLDCHRGEHNPITIDPPELERAGPEDCAACHR
jgi:Cytochrome c7 and related cytochrome c/Class III cytochrome C family